MNIHISATNVKNSFLKGYRIITSEEQLEIYEKGISNSKVYQIEMSLKKFHI